MRTSVRLSRPIGRRTLLCLCMICVVNTVASDAKIKTDEQTTLASSTLHTAALSKTERRLLEQILDHRQAVQEIKKGDGIWPEAVYRKDKKLFQNIPDNDKAILTHLILSTQIIRDPGIEPMDLVKSVSPTSYLLESTPTDPTDFLVEVETTSEFHQRADRLFQQGQYREAFPLLLTSAKYGYRNSQSQLAFILFQGLEAIPRDDIRAFAWLGTASTSTPISDSLYSELLSRLRDADKQIVDEVVKVYRERFGVVEPFDCDALRSESRSMKKIYCQLQLEAVIKNCGQSCAG